MYFFDFKTMILCLLLLLTAVILGVYAQEKDAELIIVKLGGSAITDKGKFEQLDAESLDAQARQFQELQPNQVSVFSCMYIYTRTYTNTYTSHSHEYIVYTLMQA